MFEEIKRDDAIFQSELFLKDEIAYSIMFSILNNVEKYQMTKIFFNGCDCVIVNSDSKHAIIVWTADNFQEYDELYNFIKKEFHQNSPFQVMEKGGFYDYLVKNKIISDLKGEKTEDGRNKLQTLGAWSCKKLNDIQYVGYPDQAKSEEVMQIAQMLVDFDRETKEEPGAEMSDNYIKLAQEFVSDSKHLVWRDQNDKVVSIATLNVNGKYPRVGRVFTDEKERRKSYAKMLVHYLTSKVLKEGKTSMLYTDYDYEPSNRCYQGVGYQLNRTIVKLTSRIG